jgi:hypothetical protein
MNVLGVYPLSSTTATAGRYAAVQTLCVYFSSHCKSRAQVYVERLDVLVGQHLVNPQHLTSDRCLAFPLNESTSSHMRWLRAFGSQAAADHAMP